jgi:hypothetical protein
MESLGSVLYTYPNFGGSRCEFHIEWHEAGRAPEGRVTGVVVLYTRGKGQEELRYAAGEEARVEPDLRRAFDRLGTPYADHAETFAGEAAAVVRGIMRAPTARLVSDLRSNSIGNGCSRRQVAEPRRAGVVVAVGLIWALGVWRLTRRA